MTSEHQHFLERYQHAYRLIAKYIPEHLRLGRCVDLACGVGNGAAAAAAHGAALVLGLDRSLNEFGSSFSIKRFPELCNAAGVPSRRAIFAECDVLSLSMPEQFEYILFIDGAEHVPSPPDFFAWAHDTLVPGGCLLVSSNPLFFSSAGHHLWQYFPTHSQPWAHLKPNFLEKCEQVGVSSWALQRFHELNRFTHSQLRTSFLAAGFEIIAEGKPSPEDEHADLLNKHSAGIDPAVPKHCLIQDAFEVCGRRPMQGKP